jgi:uncharacterized protein with NRDE domain
VCLILFALGVRADAPLVLAANRDEEHARPTAPAARWQDDPRIFGGRDLRAGGTWLGATRRVRVAALTNVRSPTARRVGKSRGVLVRRVLDGTAGLAIDVETAIADAAAFPAFNLLAFEPSGAERVAAIFGSEEATLDVAPGVHGLSNARLDERWPKVERGRRVLGEILGQPGEIDREAVFGVLAERTLAADAELPSTGVPLELERALSPAFIVSPVYGTRSSTVLTIATGGWIDFEERSFSPSSELRGTVRDRWRAE